MHIHPINWRYGTNQMREIFSYEHFIKVCALLELKTAEIQAKYKLIPLTQRDLEEIRLAIENLDVKEVIEEEKRIKHDIFALLTVLAKKTPKAEWIHVGLTSEDIKDTARVIILRKALSLVIKKTIELAEILADFVEKYADLACVGRTHGIHAAPITLGYKFAVFLDEIKRHISRLLNVYQEIGYGKLSGPVGTHNSLGDLGEKIEKEVLAEFNLSPAKSATQLVPRDTWAHMFLILAMLSTTLQKMATEVRNLQRTEILEVAEPFSPTQIGSSALPHKQNPVMCERVSGLSRVVRALAHAFLENTVLWHERDMSNSAPERCIMPEIFLLVDEQLEKMKKVISGLRVFGDNIKRNLELTYGAIFDETLVTLLVLKGISRMRAYMIVRKLVEKAFKERKHLKEIILEEKEIKSIFSEDELRKIFEITERIKIARKRALEILKETQFMLEKWKQQLNKLK